MFDLQSLFTRSVRIRDLSAGTVELLLKVICTHLTMLLLTLALIRRSVANAWKQQTDNSEYRI